MAKVKADLTKIQQARMAALVNAVLAAAERDRNRAEQADLAAQFTDEELDALVKVPASQLAAKLVELGLAEATADIHLTRSALIVARDARNPKGKVPYYLMMAHERDVSRIRVAGDRDPSPVAQGFVLPVAEDRPLAMAELVESDTEKDRDE